MILLNKKRAKNPNPLSMKKKIKKFAPEKRQDKKIRKRA